MQIFGHRGAAGEAPENTLAGIQHAVDLGISKIEIDLRLSADRQLVVLHDRSLKRTAGVNQHVDEMTVAELAALDARQGCKKWPHANDCGVPSLRRLISAIPSLDCIQLEVKSDDSTDLPATAEKLLEAFPTKEAAGQVVVTSFDKDFIQQMKERGTHIRRGLISKSDIKQSFEDAQALACNFLCLHHRLLTNCTESFAQTLADSPLHISAWTVNKESVLRKLIRHNVDSIITDYPSKILPLIHQSDR